MKSDERSVGIVIAASIPRLALAAVFGAAGAYGLKAGIECRFDWAAIGASLLMLAWSVRWLISIAALIVPAGGALFGSMIAGVQSIGFLAAAAFFIVEFFIPAPSWWGFWPASVAILFLATAVVYIRDVVRTPQIA